MNKLMESKYKKNPKAKPAAVPVPDLEELRVDPLKRAAKLERRATIKQNNFERRK
jgi:hypothetical protein